VLIGGLGYLIKLEIAKGSKKKKNEQKEKEVRGEFRTKVIDEFINIYSGFYEIRKIYNSIITHKNQVLDLNTINNLKEQCLKDTVKFDAKFGLLKVRLTNHYDLPKGHWEKTGIELLKTKISETPNNKYKDKLRLKLDLLGEYNSLWLDSIQLGNEIEPGKDIELHELYDSLLSDLEYSKISAPSEQ
jgi:hypothetical protein